MLTKTICDKNKVQLKKFTIQIEIEPDGKKITYYIVFCAFHNGNTRLQPDIYPALTGFLGPALSGYRSSWIRIGIRS